jgi:hypothetical protein
VSGSYIPNWQLTTQLTGDLAEYLRKAGWITFRELQVRGIEGGRVDVAAIRDNQYINKELRAYEVKVSREDFRADEGVSKWKKYLGVFHRVYFAAPVGVLRKEEIPQEAGLIVNTDHGWQVVKHAPAHCPANLNVDAMLSFVFAGHDEAIAVRRLKERIATEENIPLTEKAKRIGGEISARLAGKRGEVEPWAYDILRLCEEITGEKMADNYTRYDLNRQLRKVIQMTRYLELIFDFADFVEEFRSHGLPEDPRLKTAVRKVKEGMKKASETHGEVIA